ncbi:peptidylprolyl isomerase [Paenibacillus senegalensis]|uniref:peptidylprolyl isomerase n=1 Tax=Paenibacillus senegalensis TaxID=1465766 RepID=UPI000287C18C|nr:peptidylprolyl isomerase [Paenibacillus senegalensis]
MLQNRQRRARLFLSSLALLLVLVLLAACGNKNEGGEEPGEQTAPGDVVASYEGGSVTKAEFDKFIDTVSFFNAQFASVRDLPEFQEYILQQMVALELMYGQAGEESKEGADEEVNKQLEDIRTILTAQGGENAFEEQLETFGITEEDIRSYIQKSFVVMTDLESKVTDEEIQAYYDDLNEQNVLDVVTVSHVLIALKNQDGSDLRTKEEALERANEVKEKLDGGADFGEIAKQYSDDGGSKDNGGTYENEVLGQSMWVPEFKQAAQELPIDTISEPIETQHGYHIMKVSARNPQPLDEVREPIRDTIASEKIAQFISEELSNYNFETFLPQPEPTPEESPEGTPEDGSENTPQEEGDGEGEGEGEQPPAS